MKKDIDIKSPKKRNKERLILSLKNALVSSYSKLSLRKKISVPFVVVFLGIWISGSFGIGYYLARVLEKKQLQQVAGIASLVLREFQQETQKIRLNAKLLVEAATIPQEVETGNKTALMQHFLPLKSTLSLDLIKVVDRNGNLLINLRSTVLNQAKISDQIAISQVLSGVDLSTIVKSEKPFPFVLVGTAPIKSSQGVIGGLIIGAAVSDKLLNEITEQTNKYIVAFQNGEIIASTLPEAEKFSWQAPPPIYRNQISTSKVKIGDRSYIAKTTVISGLDNTELTLVILSSVAPLETAKQNLWLVIGLFSLVGAGIVITVGYVVSDLIASRIISVTNATEKLASGDLKTRLPVIGNDELDRLAKGFNLMAEELAEREHKITLQVQQLEQTLQQLSTTQARLIQAEKMSSLGQIVAGIAHEINNPVSFIYGNVHYAIEYVNDLLKMINIYQQEYPEPTAIVQQTISEIELEFLAEDLHKLLISMKSGAERISNIVKSLRTFSRLDESGMKSVDIHENIESTLSVLQHRLHPSEQVGNKISREIMVVKEYGDLPIVTCNPGQLNQVFFHIINNAIDSLDQLITRGEKTKNPQILIKTEVTDSNSVKIIIADNGQGMTEKVQQKIFDPFFTTKSIGSGTGLGLSISYSIVVDNHRGQLSCISVPEAGAEFTIEIPIASNSEMFDRTTSRYS